MEKMILFVKLIFLSTMLGRSISTCNVVHIDMFESLSRYWTDNGACYYYDSDKDNYENTLIAVKNYADDVGLPFRYLQVHVQLL